MTGTPDRLRTLASLWPLAPGLVLVAGVTGALTRPDLTAAAVAASAVLAASVRWPRATAIGFMVAGPLFLSGYPAGPVTLDNVAVLYGAGVAVFWLLTATRRGSPLSAWPLSVALAVAVAALANGGVGLDGAVRFLSLALLVLVLVNSDPVVRDRSVVWVEVAVTLGALVLVAQPFTGYPAAFGTAEGVGSRFGGLFGHPNFAAYTISLVLLHQVYARRFHLARIGSVGILLLALVLTGSRAALIVFVLLLLPALWMRTGRFFGLLFPAAVALPFVGTTILTRVQSIVATGGLSGQNASGWRFGQWADVLAATRGHEYFGIGWGQTVAVLSDQLGAHSTYLQILLELGRVGAVVTLVGAIVLVRAARSERKAQVLLAYAAVTGISDPVLLYPSCLTVLLVVLSHLLPPDGDREHVPPGIGTPGSPGPRPAGDAAPTPPLPMHLAEARP